MLSRCDVFDRIFNPARRIFVTLKSELLLGSFVLKLFCLECIAHNFDRFLSGWGINYTQRNFA